MAITAPTNPIATAASSGEIDLTWGASTTSGGTGNFLSGDFLSGDFLMPASPFVTAYRIFRNGVQIASVSAAALSFSDMGLTPQTTYTYFIIGVDSINEQAPSATVHATTLAVTAPVGSILPIFETRAGTFTVRDGPDMLTFATSQLTPANSIPFPGQRVEFRAFNVMVLHNPTELGRFGVTSGLSVLPGEMKTPWGDLAARGNHPA